MIALITCSLINIVMYNIESISNKQTIFRHSHLLSTSYYVSRILDAEVLLSTKILSWRTFQMAK